MTIFLTTNRYYIFIKKDEEIKFYFDSNTIVRIKRSETGEIDKIPLEEYIVGVISGEMPASFELEALKAQATAARTYVMKKIIDNKDKEYDVIDTTLNQVYLDTDSLKKRWQDKYNEYINKMKTAVKDTQGQYLTYKSEIIDALYFSTSVGSTENSEEVFVSALPYLRSVDSSWDAEVSPVFSENNDFSLQEFYNRLGLKYSEKLDIEILEKTSTGRVKQIKINGVIFDSSSIVNKLNLRSNHFSIQKDGNILSVTTKGYGHGVGMSQYGAQAMALKGYSYDEILKYYYQNVDIKIF